MCVGGDHRNHSAAVKCAMGFRLTLCCLGGSRCYTTRSHTASRNVPGVYTVCVCVYIHPLMAAIPSTANNDDVCCLVNQEHYLNGIHVNGSSDVPDRRQPRRNTQMFSMCEKTK